MSLLFSPLKLNDLELPNRIIIPPMCQYSAIDGQATDWHTIHYGNLALSGAGLLIIEATAVSPEGRISPADLGLWSDETEASFKPMLTAIRAYSQIPISIQLAHAGRKASKQRPWEGEDYVKPKDGGWQTVAPSALAYAPGDNVPIALSEEEIEEIKAAYVQAAIRADRLDFDSVELHCAHGYLMHEFLSPLTNKRTDIYGGSLENRMRLPLEIFKAIRNVIPASKPVGVRISATDWVEGGWNVEESIVFTQELKKLGSAYIHVSGGGLSAEQKMTPCPGYQTGFAAAIKSATALPTIAVGLISEPEQAETILFTAQADMIAVGRTMLYNPHWPWQAAAHLKAQVAAVPQYLRSTPRGVKALFKK